MFRHVRFFQLYVETSTYFNVSPVDGLSKVSEKRGAHCWCMQPVGRSHGVLILQMRLGAFRLGINLQIERFAATVGRSSFIDTVWNFFRLAVGISFLILLIGAGCSLFHRLSILIPLRLRLVLQRRGNS